MEPQLLDAGRLEYKTPVQLSLFVSNTGEVYAGYRFIPPPDPIHNTMRHRTTCTVFPKWLSAVPARGLVPPGQTAEVKLTVRVTGGIDGVADELTSIADYGEVDALVGCSVEYVGSVCLFHFVQIVSKPLRNALGVPCCVLFAA